MLSLSEPRGIHNYKIPLSQKKKKNYKIPLKIIKIHKYFIPVSPCGNIMIPVFLFPRGPLLFFIVNNDAVVVAVHPDPFDGTLT